MSPCDQTYERNGTVGPPGGSPERDGPEATLLRSELQMHGILTASAILGHPLVERQIPKSRRAEALPLGCCNCCCIKHIALTHN